MRRTMRGAAWIAASVLLMGCPGEPVKPLRVPSLAEAPAPTPAKASLPATYEGTIPCADCPGLQWTLAMWPDGVFYLRTTPMDGPETHATDASTYEIGRWDLTSDGTKLQLFGTQDLPISFAVKSATRLRKLDPNSRELDSGRQYDLVRQKDFTWFEPRVQVDGMYLGGQKGGTFTECLTQRDFSIASEAQRRTLDAHLRHTQVRPNVAVLATIEGRIVAEAEGEAAGRHGIDVHRVVHVWPGETCGRRFAAVRLEDTDWKLVRLRGQPVVPSGDAKDIHLRFRSDGRTLQGFAGCNQVRGRYELEEQRLRIIDLATTQMTCDARAETEKGLLDGLVGTATWKIRGDHLELYEQNGTGIGRFEVRHPASKP